MRSKFLPGIPRACRRLCAVVSRLPNICRCGNFASFSHMVCKAWCPCCRDFFALGFFLSMPSPTAAAPNRAVSLVYLGAVVLAISVLILGVGLLRTP